MARGLVNPREGVKQVRLFNLLSLPHTVHKGTIAGPLKTVAEVRHPHPDESELVATRQAIRMAAVVARRPEIRNPKLLNGTGNPEPDKSRGPPA